MMLVDKQSYLVNFPHEQNRDISAGGGQTSRHGLVSNLKEFLYLRGESKNKATHTVTVTMLRLVSRVLDFSRAADGPVSDLPPSHPPVNRIQTYEY